MALRTGDALLLLHNPRCSKSRAAKALLEARGARFELRLYLEGPLSKAELAELRRSLGRPARDWVRRGAPRASRLRGYSSPARSAVPSPQLVSEGVSGWGLAESTGSTGRRAPSGYTSASSSG